MAKMKVYGLVHTEHEEPVVEALQSCFIFMKNWAGTNFIQKPHDWPDSQAAQVTYQDMIDRVSEQGMLFDNSGQLVAFVPMKPKFQQVVSPE